MFAVLEITLPVFAIVGLGTLAARARLLSDEAVTGLNAFLFWFALPAMVIKALSGLKLAEAFDARFALVYALCVFVAFIGCLQLSRSASKLQRTALALNAVHGNIGYLGLPLVAQFGAPRLMAPIILALTLDIAALIVSSIVLFEFHSRRDASSDAPPTLGSSLMRALVATIRSPLVMSIAVGALLSLTQWKLPVIVQRLVDMLGAAAPPCALFAIGAAFGGQKVRVTSTVVQQVAIKLFALPLLAALCFWIGGVDRDYAAIGVLAAALPAASNGFILGRRYGADTVPISTSIVVGTAVAAITVTLLIAWLGLGR